MSVILMPPALKLTQLLSIILTALTAGMFFGPWAALSISMKSFGPEVFLAIVDRMNRNMGPLMTVLMPADLLSLVAVLVFSYRAAPGVFHLTTAAFVLMVLALAVTMLVEVPIVRKISGWTVATLPADWEQLRDRWTRFHIIRVAAGLTSLLLLVTAALF